MIRHRSVHPRRGYSLTVVVIFLILLFALWSTISRTTSSLLRIETNRINQQTRDQSAMNALGQAIQLLQYSAPVDTTNPNRTQFTYGVQLTVTGPTGSCETISYTVQYNPAPAQGSNCWQVQVYPGTYSVPLPNPGAIPQWP
jgi:Tfp pilus assembly protein PilX